MNMNELMSIADRWLDKAQIEGLKPNTKKHDTAEYYFWLGVMSLLMISGSTVPPIVGICLASGRSVSQTLLKAI